ncbi:MAG: HAD-IA family hydrolase [Gammaproteobacteria bacterium]|nr:HAD-IA family hydrolase [Gammaproteobacteria bacterium]
MSAPRGLLLDFGAVISVSLFERHRDTEALLGLRAGTLGWLGPIAPETDLLWQAMQRDELSEREYWARRARELGSAVGEPDWDVKTMMARVRQTDPAAVVRPEMRQLIAVARSAGVRLGILSNELELFYGAEFLGRMGVIEEFDAVVDATHTGVLKPDARAYAQAAEEMRLAPGAILFVDDQRRNVAGAARAGMQSQHFELRDIPGSFAAIGARLRLQLPQRHLT